MELQQAGISQPPHGPPNYLQRQRYESDEDEGDEAEENRNPIYSSGSDVEESFKEESVGNNNTSTLVSPSFSTIFFFRINQAFRSDQGLKHEEEESLRRTTLARTQSLRETVEKYLTPKDDLARTRERAARRLERDGAINRTGTADAPWFDKKPKEDNLAW